MRKNETYSSPCANFAPDCTLQLLANCTMQKGGMFVEILMDPHLKPYTWSFLPKRTSTFIDATVELS